MTTMLTRAEHVTITASGMLSRAPLEMCDFVSLFGVFPKVVAAMWTVTHFENDIKLRNLLWALTFLKTYLTAAVLISLARARTDQKTWHKKVFSVLGSLKSSKAWDVIRWEDRLKNDKGKTCKVSINGTDFLIQKQTSHALDKMYYSYKFRHAAFRYEINVCIQNGDIVWLNVPFKPGVWNDLMIFQRSLKHKLLPGEMVEANRGYRDS